MNQEQIFLWLNINENDECFDLDGGDESDKSNDGYIGDNNNISDSEESNIYIYISIIIPIL